MSLPRFGVRRPVPVNLLMMALLIGGVYCGLSLRRQFFPETTPDRAMIAMPYPGATPEEVEDSLAIKIEDRVADLDEVDEIVTTINEGGGSISVEFHDGVRNIDKAVDEVERTVDALQDLPEQAEEITVTELEPRMPAIMLALYGDASERELKQGIRAIKDELETLAGMGEIILSGVRDYEIRVDVDREAMLKHDLSLPLVAGAIRSWMTDVPGGMVRSDVGTFSVRALGVEERASAIEDIVIAATPEGQALRVGDIADVQETFVDEQIITRFNGKPSAELIVFKKGDEDIVEIAEMVRAYVDAHQGRSFEFSPLSQFLEGPRYRAYQLGLNPSEPLPEGTNLQAHSDLARFVEGRLQLLTENALYGAVLVFLTLFLFLNWRGAWWVGVGLTTALAGTMIVMYVLDITLNLLTMFGLIVVLGLLVDDAIVVAENIQAKHDRGEPALVSAIGGAEQVSWPVVATVLTSIVAFLPLTFIRGQIGDLLGALPLVVSCALAMSLVESLLILPSHIGHSLAKRDRKSTSSRMGKLMLRYENWRDRIFFSRIIPAYERVVRLALHYRYLSLAAAIAALVATVAMVAGGRIGYEFLPSSDAETVEATVRMPIGTAIERTEEVVQRLEDAARAQTEVRSISTTIGREANIETGRVQSAATHLAQIFIELIPVEQRELSSSQVINAIRDHMGRVDEAERISFMELSGGPSGADLSLQVRGADNDVLIQVANDIQTLLRTYEGVVDISDDNSLGQRELQIKLKPGAASLGFTVANLAEQVRGAVFGLEAHTFAAKREDIDVRVMFDEFTRRNLNAIQNMWVRSPTGEHVPLSEVAELVDGTSYSTIRRVDRQRTITVTAETIPSISPESVFVDLQPALREIKEQYPGIEIALAGRQEQQREAFATLPIGFGAAMLMIYVILAWLFSSYIQPIAVMLGVPFAIIGVIWGHWLLDFQMTFLSMIGFVALSGIVVNDSLILVKFYNEQREQGVGLIEGLVAAGKQRLRPIFLTTVTTVLGLTPLMMEESFQARFLIPMAIAIAFGLMSATVLILVILPCILVIVDDMKAIAHFLWFGRTRSTESLPAASGFEMTGS